MSIAEVGFFCYNQCKMRLNGNLSEDSFGRKSDKMKKINDTVRNETLYIIACVTILSLLMQSVFLIIGMWDYTVLLGNLLSAAGAIGNFFLMGITVQTAVEKEEKQAAELMRFSQTMRMFLLLAVAVLGVVLSCFNTAAAIIPLFFPRIALIFRPFFKTDDDSAQDAALHIDETENKNNADEEN